MSGVIGQWAPSPGNFFANFTKSPTKAHKAYQGAKAQLRPCDTLDTNVTIVTKDAFLKWHLRIRFHLLFCPLGNIDTMIQAIASKVSCVTMWEREKWLSGVHRFSFWFGGGMICIFWHMPLIYMIPVKQCPLVLLLHCRSGGFED